MLLSDLKKQAAKILEINLNGDFEVHTFSAKSGGIPQIVVDGITPVNKTYKFRYGTAANGSACSGAVEIMCQKTEAKDSNNRSIYVTPSGVTFVYRYSSGSAYSFDRGIISPPEFDIETN